MDQQDRIQRIGWMLNTDEEWNFVNGATGLSCLTTNLSAKPGDGRG